MPRNLHETFLVIFAAETFNEHEKSFY